jgi:hypothetical protein
VTPSFEMVVEGVSAQDLFFVERAVPNVAVEEHRTHAGGASFGQPDLIEAVILMATSGAVSAALAWVMQTRKSGRVRIRRRSEPGGTFTEDFEVRWNESESKDKAIQQLDNWLAGSSGVGRDVAG